MTKQHHRQHTLRDEFYRLSLLILSASWLAGFLYISSANALSTDRDQPVNIEADWAEADDLRRLAIYKGHVIVIQGSLRITGDVITMYFDKDNALIRMIAIGELARFQQRPDGETDLQRGKAARIIYSQEDSLLTLIGDAQLAKGDDEINADYITYDTLKARIRGETQSSIFDDGISRLRNRVRITVKPKPKEKEDENTDPPTQ